MCLVYDPYRSSQGVLALKALKLTDSFMEVYRGGNVTADALAKGNISWQDIFEEIPISIANSTLHSVLMQEIESDAAANQADFDRLVLSTNPYLEKNLEFLSECLDDLQVEQQKISFYNRNAARQQQQQAQWLQKRRAENFQRRAAGEEPLPEEDNNNPIFKALSEPSKLDSLLITNQINNYCNQINKCVLPPSASVARRGPHCRGPSRVVVRSLTHVNLARRFASQGMEKLYLMQGLHTDS